MPGLGGVGGGRVPADGTLVYRDGGWWLGYGAGQDREWGLIGS